MAKKIDFASKILKDMKVVLMDKFSNNFREGGFFGQAWQHRTVWRKGQGRIKEPSHLIRTGNLRRSLKVRINGHSITFYSNLPYAAVHNYGLVVRHHQMPERKFIGMYAALPEDVQKIVNDNMKKVSGDIFEQLKKHKK